MTNIVGVTACPTGVAHTYLAAESLEIAAKKKGWGFQVETQGAIGAENELTSENINNADIVILTKDVGISGEERFKDKKVVRVSSHDLVRHADQVLEKIENHLKK